MLSNGLAEMFVGIKKGRKNVKMEGRKEEEDNRLLIEVVKCKTYVLEKKKASARCRSRAHSS